MMLYDFCCFFSWKTPPSNPRLEIKESIDANADGNVTFWEFARAVADGPAAHTLQNFVTRFRGLAVKNGRKQHLRCGIGCS